MNNFEYVNTKNGLIYKDDIPVVVSEELGPQSKRALLFFLISVVIIVILLYNSNITKKTKKIPVVSKNLLNTDYDLVPSSVMVDNISIYDTTNTTEYIKDIILIDVENNAFALDAIESEFIIKDKFYSINLGDTYHIKSIILVTDGKPRYINIELSNDGKKTWEHAGYLQNKKENTIIINERVNT